MRATSARRALLLISTAILSGCVPGTFSEELRQTRLQVESLSQRVSRLETVRGGGSSTAYMDTASVTEEAADATAHRASDSSFRAGSAFSKLTRGLINTVTGWVEIPKRIHETSQRSGPFAGFTWGLLRGLGYGFIRTVGGVYETVTFPVAAPPGYRPVMQPEFVFMSDSG